VTKKFIKPARAGLVVRQPHNGQALPPEGALVDWSGHWVRRKAEGAIVVTQPPKPNKPGKHAKMIAALAAPPKDD
tara:strand:+ start:280 stop:504 length:225 start_codon:yes stop_codon:yes gene_type:complete